MHAFPTFSLLLLLALVVGSGCAGPAATRGLEATTACPVAWLEETGSTDCESLTAFHRVPAPAVPPGWKCLAQKSFNPRATLGYYHNGAGEVGFWFDWTDWQEPVIPLGRAALYTGGQPAFVDFGPADSGFVRFPGTHANGTIRIVSYGFAASGTPSFLDTENLSVLQLHNPDGQVFVMRFTAPDGATYQFAEPTRFPDARPGFRWGPSNVRVHGDDFEVHLRFQRGIVTEHDFEFRNRDPRVSLLPGPGCDDARPFLPSSGPSL